MAGYGVKGLLPDEQGRIRLAPIDPKSLILLSPVGRTKLVTTSGIAGALTTDPTKTIMLFVRAQSTNTGNIYFGDSGVNKVTSQQVILTSGQSVSIDVPAGYCISLNQFYIDADVNNEGVDLLYI